MEPETLEELQKRVEELNSFIELAFKAIGPGPDVRIDEAVAALVAERDAAREQVARLEAALRGVPHTCIHHPHLACGGCVAAMALGVKP